MNTSTNIKERSGILILGMPACGQHFQARDRYGETVARPFL
jgi:hypothetical protein